jgi:hypothetical protein
MKNLLLLVALCATISLAAQKNKNKQDIPAFGKVEKTDLELKECDFDKSAEAVVLIDDAELDFVDGFEMTRRVRVKILSDKGLDQANIHLTYRSEKNEQDIRSIEAQTYNLDAAGNIVVTKLEKSLIYEKKLNKKRKEKVFTFPEVKVGSIIEYKYKKTGIGLIDWYFQESIPVKFSHFKLDFPQEVVVNVRPVCSRPYEEINQNSSFRYTKDYVMRDIPALRDEPYIINEDYYKDRLETKVVALDVAGRRDNLSTNWIKVIEYLMQDEDFGIQLKKNIPRTADLDEKLKNVTDPYFRMKIIYKYVQDNMQWNEYVGIWALDGVKSAWKDKKGTVGEINLILVNLLKDADLNAHPVLVSTHENGVVNTADAGTRWDPGFLQFDKVMAYVEIGDKSYVLDATEKQTPAHLIPEDVLMTEGLVIEKIDTYEWGWKTLYDKNMSAKDLIAVSGVIDESGKMNGEVMIASYDYSKIDRLPLVKKGKDKFIEACLKNAQPGLAVDDVTFENLDNDSLPLVQKIKFNEALNSSGDYRYFSANILTGREKNPFIADSRLSDVFFGSNQSLMLIGNFTIPEGYEFETLPKNIKMIMPDTSISIVRRSQVQGNMLQTQIQLNFDKPYYPASQYEELHEFYKQLFDLLNEQFVIRKKK